MKEANIHCQTNSHKSWNAATHKFEYTFEFKFQTKAHYLEFRRGWKQHYASHAMSIRSLKALIRQRMWKREYAGDAQREFRRLKLAATVQLLMLKSAKQEAARQYLAARHNAP